MPEKPSRYPADLTKVHLVKLIEHASKESDRLLQFGATQQVHLRGCAAVFVFVLCE